MQQPAEKLRSTCFRSVSDKDVCGKSATTIHHSHIQCRITIASVCTYKTYAYIHTPKHTSTVYIGQFKTQLTNNVDNVFSDQGFSPCESYLGHSLVGKEMGQSDNFIGS